MKDLTAGEPVFVFQIARRNDLVRQDQFRQIRSILCQGLHHGLAERITLLIPIALQLIGRVLHVNRHDMLAFGR